MTITGFANPGAVIRFFIAAEYAFSFTLHDKEIRIAHHKGIWTIIKYGRSTVIDWFTWSDVFSGVDSINELTKNLAGYFNGKGRAQTRDNVTRETESAWIVATLEIWAGPLSDVQQIYVVQPGRNASLDLQTGEFNLSPRPNEFVQ